MRPNGEANTASPASSSQPFTSGRKPKPVVVCRSSQLAVSRYTSQRTPEKMNSGTDSTVCAQRVASGVGRGLLNVARQSVSVAVSAMAVDMASRRGWS